MNRNTVSCSAFLSRLGRFCALAVAGLFAATATADPYLTFSSEQSFTITPPRKTWAGTIEYSTDATTWTVFNAAGAAAADDGTGTHTLHLRGAGNRRISASSTSAAAWTLTASANVACSGNAETLLDYTAVVGGQHPAMDAYCFANLFKGSTALTDAPALHATNLANYCYYGMFQGCKGLTNAPALPATKLASYCYHRTFQGCTSLTQAPELPATNLANNCYQYMFSGCTALTDAPALPATTLAKNCYQAMFLGCTGIKLHKYGPGAEWGIPAGTTTPNYWNTSMFAGTSGTFTANPVRGTVYYYETADFPAFNRHYLTFSSADTFTIAPQQVSWTGMIESSTDATNWTTFGTAGAAAADDGSGTHMLYLRGAGNTYISAAANAAAWTLDAAGAVVCSGNIETLLDYTAVAGGLHPTMTDYCFANLFKGWTALTEAPVLRATNLATYCYSSMFQGCTGLAQAPDLPATKLANYCYQYMFQGCTGLTEVPELSAKALANYCYQYMFQNCTGIKLNTEEGPGEEWGIPAGAVARTGWNRAMLAGTGGTFTGNPVIGTVYYYEFVPDPDPDPEAPVITAITVNTGASTLAITVGNAITGAWYTLLMADELVGQPWVDGPTIQATADGILDFLGVDATPPRRFYKVRASAIQP